MRVVVDCNRIGEGLLPIDVDFEATVDDLVTLLTVKIPSIDYDGARIYFNGQLLKRDSKIVANGIRDGYQVELRTAGSNGCCSIL